MILLAMY